MAALVGGAAVYDDAASAGASGGSGSGASSGSEEEDLAEPLLKYQRLGGLVGDLLGDRAAAGGAQQRDALERSPVRGTRRASTSVSCVAVHARFLCVGLSDGQVLQVDFKGELLRRWHVHRDRVTAISVELDGGPVLASCSDDGRVVLYNMAGEPEYRPTVFNVLHPVKAVALEPGFSRGRDNAFVYGGVAGKLVLRKKGWFSSSETELHKGEGAIGSIAWRGRLIAWSNAAGVKVYDYHQEQRIAYVERGSGNGRSSSSSSSSVGGGVGPSNSSSSTSSSSSSSSFATGSGASSARAQAMVDAAGPVARCHLVFENDSTLLVAWDDCVKVVRIRERSREEIAGDPSSLARCAELVSLYEFVETEVICGIAPFGKDMLAVLIFLEPEVVAEDADALEDGEHDGGVQDAASQDAVDEDEQGSAGSAVSGDSQPKEASRARERLRARRPELRVLNRADGIETSIESLPVSRFEENGAALYSLAASHDAVTGVDGKPVLFVVSPFDVVLARPRNLEDHISWALRVGDYEHALALAEQAAAQPAAAPPAGAPHDFARSGLHSFSLRVLQDKLLAHLLSEGEFAKAASLCPRLLDADRDRWLQWATKFETYQMLSALAGVLPVRNPALLPVVYESVLLELLGKREYDALLYTLRQWQTVLYKHSRAQLMLKGFAAAQPPDAEDNEPLLLGADSELVKVSALYDVKKVIAKVAAVVDKAFGNAPRALRDVLAELYSADGQHHLAIREYLEGGYGYGGATIGASGDASAISSSSSSSSSSSHAGGAASATNSPGRSRSDNVFGMIERHGLIEAVIEDKVRALLRLDSARTIRLLVDAVSQELGLEDNAAAAGQVYRIVAQLGGNADGSLGPDADLVSLHQFLHQLYTRRCEEYNHERMGPLQDLQVRLYAALDQDKLRDFLETASFYSLPKALAVCEGAKPAPLYRELVFILGRMGGSQNTQRALGITIDKLRSVPLAIEFVEREGGKELWNDLVRRCVQDTTFVSDLVHFAGGHNVDPVQIVRNIAPDLVVPHLSTRLVKLFKDIKLQRRLRQGCNDILKQDVVALLRALHRSKKRAVHVPASAMSAGTRGARCGVCKQPLAKNLGLALTLPQLVVFGSGHVYHQDCLEAAARMLDPKDIETLDVANVQRVKVRHCIVYARRTLLATVNPPP